MSIELLHMDCMEYMKTQPDNAFDLAIVDPPYGIGAGNGFGDTRKKHQRAVRHTAKDWDREAPGPEYFGELRRVSKNQIVWGANYMTPNLPASMGWIFWFKRLGGDFSDGEFAFTSFKRAAKMVSIWAETGGGAPQRIHPTQKPVKLYQWLLENYAKPGQRILDTHLGSGSSAIAAHYFGVDFVGTELDADYYQAAKARFERETAQIDIFQEVAQ